LFFYTFLRKRKAKMPWEPDNEYLEWWPSDSLLDARIQTKLDAIFLDWQVHPRDEAHQFATNLKQKISNDIAKITGFTTVNGDVSCEVSDLIPTSVAKILGGVTPATFWFLINAEQIRRSIALLHNGASVLARDDIKKSEVLNSSANLLDKELKDARQSAQDTIRKILGIPGDTLGCHIYDLEDKQPSRIRIYWLVVWIVSQNIGVGFEELIAVVMAHEYGHAYTLRGLDANAHAANKNDDLSKFRWNTELYSQSDIYIKEGLAQYFSSVWCSNLGKKRITPRDPMTAFEELLKRQSEPYTWFETWRDISPEKIRAELRRVRKLGYPVGRGEWDPKGLHLGQVKLSKGDLS
jgi:hypothetical protein